MLCTTVTKSSILPIKFAHLAFCLNGAEDEEHRHKFFDQSYAFAKIQCKVQHEIFVNRLIFVSGPAPECFPSVEEFFGGMRQILRIKVISFKYLST